ncbi:hypothetical protein Pcinc_005567 [Petrolisthes cinctipes]|uniref:Core-binding (CB) domain-containing protein n=1 Tax=Petrolisthes cinctipes TaxID=88211 RepID=A0AAE1GD87_PETCI|nr:hypothetical protein Pcinc_005567 [Petrolisthes cinctipes]
MNFFSSEEDANQLLNLAHYVPSSSHAHNGSSPRKRPRSHTTYEEDSATLAPAKKQRQDATLNDISSLFLQFAQRFDKLESDMAIVKGSNSQFLQDREKGKSKKHPTPTGPTSRNSVSLNKRCHLRGPLPTLFHLQDLPGTKIKGRQSSHNRSQLSQQPHSRPILPHAQPQKSGGFPSSTSLDVNHRLEGCLPTCSHPTMFTQVSCFLYRIKTLFFPNPTVWSECGSTHLYPHSKMDSFPPTPAGNQCHRLFRRLGHLGNFSRIDSKGCQHSDQPSEHSRLPHQLPKVPPPPFNRRGMVRDSLVPPIRTLGSSGGQTNVHPVIHKACSITKTSLTQAMRTYFRQTQLCHPNTTPQSTPATTIPAPPNSFKPLAPRRSEATAYKLSQTPVTVATSQNVVNFPPFPPLRKHDPPLDQCFPFRLGRSHSISSGLRHLGQERVNLAHKLSRSSSSPSLHSVTQPFKLPTSSIYRQSSSAMCDKQAKMQINLPVTRNLNSQQPSQLSQNSHTCFQDFFPFKFKGGQPEQTFKHLNRVVTSKTNLQADSNLERPIRNRSNGNMQKQEATSVLLTSSSPKGSCLERAGPRLEQRESNLSLPSKVVTPSGAEETGILPSPLSDNSSLVSNGALVQLNTEQVNRPDATQPRRSRKEWVACIREMDRLQFLRTSLSIQHDEDIASHLSAAYRASTTRQAQSNWKVFQQWLPADISDITENVILRFLIYLDEVKKLSPHTIMNYRNALALPLQLSFGINMSHRSFSLLAKSQFLRRPPPAKKVPTWSIDTALVTFSRPEFNPPEASTEKLLLKALFLTALATANRASELASTIREGITVTNGQATLPVQRSFLFKN